MNDREIEREINARVKSKMKDVLSWLKNQVGLNWQIAFEKGSQKHEYYW